LKYATLLKENEDLREKLTSTQETLRLIKNNYDVEKKNNRELMTDHANFFTRRNELEDLFRKCVAEVKKEVSKRKRQSSRIEESEMPHPFELINVDQFTATDKRKVIDLLVSNEHVLLFLYEKLFPAKTDPIVKEILSVENKKSFFGRQSYS